MTFALALSWLSMLVHNLYELPLAVTDAENAGPLVIAAGLAIAAWKRPGSPWVNGAILAWSMLNLVAGGLLTVLPLSVLPFVPEQSATHYLAHVVYSLGQLPAVVLSARRLRQGSERRAQSAELRGGS